MGNEQKEKISEKIYEMKVLIASNSYEESKKLYQKIKLELIQIKNENDIKDIVNFLINKHTDKKIGLEFQDMIATLTSKDKLGFLIQLIFENELIESIGKSVENKNVEKEFSKIIEKEKYDFQKAKEEIAKKMEKILIVDKILEFHHFRSIMFEKIAEEYYNLGTLMYSSYGTKKKQSSNELQEIVIFFTQCLENYQKTEDQKIKLEEYTNALEKVTAHQNILLGRELIKTEKFEEALECFNKVNFNNSEILEEKDKGVRFCYEKMAELEEEKDNYPEAIKYYKLINNDFKVIELNIILNRHYIIECVKDKNYENAIKYFNDIFKLVNQAKNIEFVELKFSKIFEIFMDSIVRISIFFYQIKSLPIYIQILHQLKDSFKNEGISSEMKDLVDELDKIEKNGNNLDFEYITKSVSQNNSEIKQRLYISILVIKYLNIKPKETLSILLKKEINFSYINSDCIKILKDYLEEQNNINDLYLISQIFYKIIVVFGLFQDNDILKILTNKIDHIKEVPNLEINNQFNDVIEYLILSFQEITINNKKINNYFPQVNLVSSLILKYNNFVSKISKILLFFSNNEIFLKQNIIDIVIIYLINNEKDDNDDLLDILFIQLRLQPNFIPGYLDSIYKILFNYQRLKVKNKREKIEKIFDFLLLLSEELILSDNSIKNLEKYVTENEINNLCYKLLSKIRNKTTSRNLIQKFDEYNQKLIQNQSNKNNDDINNQYQFKSTITKDDLPNFEKKLNDPDSVEKLVTYLKNQNDLFQYLNIVEISNHFSSLTKELFNLLIEKKVKFNEEALTNLLKGFYNNSDQEINDTYYLFYEIRQYQPEFPLVIEKNLAIEEFLIFRAYEKFKSYDNKLNEIYNDFSYLKGFSEQHKIFIKYFYNLCYKEKKEKKQQEILNTMTKFLIEKNFNIGTVIYEFILNSLRSPEFINIIQIVFPSKKISNKIKQMTKERLLIILKGTKNKLNLIKSFKIFVDYIQIPDQILDYLKDLLQNQKTAETAEMHREIIFILGIYFSINVKQARYYNDFIEIISQKELFQYLLNNIKSITNKNEILYLYGCLNYINFNQVPFEEEQVLQIPINLIANIINSLNPNFDKKLFFENLAYFNRFYKFGIFSPKRDRILRKLFFNHKNNSPNLLKSVSH